MRIWSQLKNPGLYGLTILSFFWGRDIFGVIVCSFVFEWARTEGGRQIQARMRAGEPF